MVPPKRHHHQIHPNPHCPPQHGLQQPPACRSSHRRALHAPSLAAAVLVPLLLLLLLCITLPFASAQQGNSYIDPLTVELKVVACADVLYEPQNTLEYSVYCPDGLRSICLFSVIPTFDPAKLRSLGCNDPKVIPVHIGNEAFYIDLRKMALENKAKISAALLELGSLGGRSYSLLADSFRYVLSIPSKVLPSMDNILTFCEKERLRVTPLLSQSALKSGFMFAHLFGSPAITTVVNAISAEVFTSSLSSLSGMSPITVASLDDREILLKTRNTYAIDNSYAAELLASYCSKSGLVFEKQKFVVGGVETWNVVCIAPGTVNPDKVVVVGAHFDSTSNTPKSLAPGAVDNGSGTSGVLAIMSAMKGHRFENTIHFAFFSGEEQGMFGSQFYVSEAVQGKWQVVGALIMDMIGYSDSYFGLKVEGTRSPAIQSLMAYMEANARIYSPELSFTSSVDSFGSDHVSFQRAGIPAVLAIEQDDTDYPAYHRDADTMEFVNVAQSMAIVRVIAATACQMAAIVS